MTQGIGTSRRRFLAGLGGLGGLTLVAACGGGGTPGAAQAGGPGFPVTVAHRFGTAEIPAPPQRIVTVGLTEQDAPIALGVVPVGTTEWFGEQPGALWPWARERLNGQPLPRVLPTEPLDVEGIAALRPDLILAQNSGLTDQQYATLSRLAPVIAQPADKPDYGATWQEITRSTARALGQDARAEEMIRSLEGRFVGVRQQYPQFAQGTGLLSASISGSAYVYPTGPAATFLRDVGLRLPPGALAVTNNDPNSPPVQLSSENLSALDADVLLLGQYDPPGSGVTTSPAWAGLRVAREGRVVEMPELSRLNGAMSFGSILSLPQALDEMPPRLAAAFDGDPATQVEPVV